MRRPVLVFLFAVLLPGLVLGGLALRSIRNQEALFERERSRVLQGTVDSLAGAIAARLDEHQRDFSLRVETLFGKEDPHEFARRFDERIRERWPLAALGFAVSLKGELLSPPVLGSAEARQFLLRNEAFLCQQGSVEVYAVTPKGRINLADSGTEPPLLFNNQNFTNPRPVPGRLHFSELIGDAQEGVLARFLEDQLAVWVWYRTPREPDLVFGAQLSLPRLREDLSNLLAAATSALPVSGVAVSLIDDRNILVGDSPAGIRADWRRPLVEAAIGAALPHWHVAAAVFDSNAAQRENRRLRVTLAAVVILLVGALAAGGWLVATDARRQLELVRRKSDFVSNVSHELRTPLTSIRLFAELLAQDRVTDPERRRRHLDVIQSEAARLQRLIGNVLDFARSERGEQRFQCDTVDLGTVATQVLDSFGPQFATDGMRAQVEVPSEPVCVRGDADALAQLVNNLVSNAGKYAAGGGEMTIQLSRNGGDAHLDVLDRGPGVPAGMEEKIFEEFYRADDALTSGIPGAGLGLTLARRIARAHGGDVTCHPRAGGGSCFRIRLSLEQDARR